MKRTHAALPQLLLAHSRAVADGCVLWVGTCFASGYGRVWDGSRARRAHRVAWELAFGAIPLGLSVLHSCDVRNCICTDHLWLGTQADNIADMVAKGRKAPYRRDSRRATGDANGARKHPERLRRGPSHPGAKLNAHDVAHIRRLNLTGASARCIASQFGVTHGAVVAILNGATWKHITVEV